MSEFTHSFNAYCDAAAARSAPDGAHDPAPEDGSSPSVPAMIRGRVITALANGGAALVAVGHKSMIVDLLVNGDFHGQMTHEELVGKTVEFSELVPCRWFAMDVRVVEEVEQ